MPSPSVAALGATERPVLAPSLHHEPPFRVTDAFAGRRAWLLVPGVLFAFLALGASIAHGALLRTWDEPIQRFVESHRGDDLTAAVLTISRFGSNLVVFALGAAVALLVWRRCRAVSVAIVLAMIGRPLFEWTLKALVDRGRPDFERLVPGNGPSFPSGHPMAAVVCYGFLPVVVALYTQRRAIVYGAWVVATVLVGAIAASRVYLGVHWFSDIVASILLGAFLLIAIEWIIERAHRVGGCGSDLDPALCREIDDDLARLEAALARDEAR